MPNLFIGNKHINCNDAIKALHNKGEFVIKMKKTRVLKVKDKEKLHPNDMVRKAKGKFAQKQSLKEDGATNFVVKINYQFYRCWFILNRTRICKA